MFSISFFIKERPEELFPLLEPLRFSTIKNQAIWSAENRKVKFIIQPFYIVGREAQGYRAYYNGSSESLQYLFDLSLSRFSPKISGVDYTYEANKSQRELITKANQSCLGKGSIPGLYRKDKIMIVILPDGTIKFQIRNHKIRACDLARVTKEIQSVVELFQPQSMDLFSFTENDEEEVYVS